MKCLYSCHREWSVQGKLAYTCFDEQRRSIVILSGAQWSVQTKVSHAGILARSLLPVILNNVKDPRAKRFGRRPTRESPLGGASCAGECFARGFFASLRMTARGA